jgi:hypothetical protein
MHLSTTSRPTRVRRLIAISAAAVAVMIGPTACNYGVVGGQHGSGSSSGDLGNNQGGGNADQSPVVVPVANRTDDRRHGRTHGGTTTTTTTAAATPVADTTTDTADPTATDDPTVDPTADPTDATTAPATPGAVGDAVPAGGKDGNNNGLDILGRDCTQSKLPLHDGFQNDPAGQGACVNTEMGEVAAKDKLPSLLITDAPRVVGMNQAFTLKVSTRNLVRDRFLGAKAGGYYLESSFLNADGLQRGHFHTACRILPSANEAPDSSVDPQFFLATEDGGGGSAPDTVTIPVPAIGKPGILQCTSWAGDGSHRTPMMTQANETPAIDSVRIFVTQRDQPVRYDARAATADSGKTDTAHAQQSGGQKPDANPAVPAAPNPAAAPATASAPVAANDNAADPTVTDASAAPASDTAAPATN